MLKKLDLYIARKFISTLVFILLMTSIVTVIFDAAEKMSSILEQDVTLTTILFDYYLNFVPTLINQISPLLVFISALYFTSRLANNSEIVAILASGTSYYRLIKPYMLVALLLLVADLGMKHYLVPKAYNKVLSFEQVHINTGYFYEPKNVHRQLDENSYFYAQAIDFSIARAYRFSLEKFEGQKLKYKLQAAEAYYDSTRNDWLVKYYVIRHIDGLDERLEKGDSMRLSIPITIGDFGRKTYGMSSMSTPELNRFIEEEKFKGESLTAFYLVEKYKRYAMPFAIPVLVLIAVALGTRKIRGGMGMHLLIGILIAISYELSMRFSTTFATNSSFSPLLAVWLPNIFYMILAAYLLIKTPK